MTTTIAQLLNVPVSDHVFHYTDGAGLIGITRNKCLWATETNHLNDQKEIEHAKDYIRGEAYNLPRHIHAQQFSADEKELLAEFENQAGTVRPGVCVVSFSEERDSLSQWRAYGAKTESFNIALSSAKLRQCAERQGCLFGRCTYDHDTQCRIASEIITDLVRRYRSSDKSDEVKNQLCNRLIIEISRYGPLLKHSSFAEEAEWRIITPQIPVGDPRWDFRTKDGKLVPFVRIDVKDALFHRDQRDGPGVIMGPGRTPGPTDFAVQSLLHCSIGIGAWHGSSNTPFSPE